MVSLCGWKARSFVWHVHVHPDLGSDQNTLNQLGPNEGHFVLSFILFIRGMSGLQGWLTEPKTRATQDTIHNNNTGVFTRHINKNIRLMPGTPAGEVTRWIGITEILFKKFANIIHLWAPERKRDKLERQNVALLFLSYISKVALILETRGRSVVLLSLTICSLQDRSAATKAVFSPLLMGD